MTLDLDNLRQLHVADAPLPWRVDDAPLGAHGLTDTDRPAPLFILDADDVQLAIIVCEPECRYLVAAANALPALLADHARLTAEVARLREALEVQHMAEANRIAGAGGCCGGCDAAWLTAEVARLRAFKLHVAGCYNSWANGGDLDPHAAVAALEAIGDELGEPWEGDRE